jgi:hypothetical protein
VTSSPNPGRWTFSRRSENVRPTWPRVGVIIGLFVLALVVAKSCQQSQIRVTQEEAIAIAKQQVDFEPKSTQVRLLRQGLNRKPFWFVSLSNPIGSPVDPEGFTRVAVVKIDGNTGKVEDVTEEGPAQDAKPRNGTGGKAKP